MHVHCVGERLFQIQGHQPPVVRRSLKPNFPDSAVINQASQYPIGRLQQRAPQAGHEQTCRDKFQLMDTKHEEPGAENTFVSVSGYNTTAYYDACHMGQKSQKMNKKD